MATLIGKDVVENICSTIYLGANYDLFVVNEPAPIPKSVESDMKKPDDRIYVKTHLCIDCDVPMGYTMIDGCMAYVCSKCGVIDNIIGDDNEHSTQSAFSGYNTMINASMPVKIVGPKSATYQKRVVSSTAEYVNTQRRVTHEQMTKLTCFVEQARVPAHIVDKAADDYHKLQKYFVKRGDVRKGIMAWLIYEICKNSGLERTPKEISTMFEITQNELSEGSKIVNQARVDGQLDETSVGYDEKGSMNAKLDRYFAALEIPAQYREFVETLIKFASDKRHKSKHSGMKAKCAGAIYLLCLSEPQLKITRSLIATKCDISPATFIRFSDIITDILALEPTNLTRKKLVHIYKKYNINVI